MTGPNNEATCPVHGCGADLYLTITSCIPLYAVNPPWPGAGEATYDGIDAVSDGWEVECTDGHKVWTSLDQIRAANALLPEDSDDWTPVDSATTPRFRFELLAEHVLGAPPTEQS